MKQFLVAFICLAILAACVPATELPTATQTVVPSPSPLPATNTPTPMPDALWVSPAVPAGLLEIAKSWGIPKTDDPALATQKLDISDTPQGSTWIYALVAPFPTVTDDVTYADLLSTWKGVPTGPTAGHVILLAESTLRALAVLWGEPASGAVRVVPLDQMVDTAWKESAWAIIPFEDIQPKWKVLSVDGQSPIHKNFDASSYSLKVHFALSSSSASFVLPESNRDPSKLATVILTGVTALTRATARKMEQKGITYPGEVLREMFLKADILHINNEAPFYSGCPQPDPHQPREVFCSSPRYIELLTDIGVDVVELSGDHFADYGDPAMFESIEIYNENHIPYYGGGMNEDDGKKPLFMEVNGNKIMFIGCDYKTVYATARATRPGSVRCDFEYMTGQIRTYRAQGYLPISTFQYNEFPSPEARSQQEVDYRTMSDAGAVVVSGSQAHVSQVMEFHNDGFIHYGLGNLFFDQMGGRGTKITQDEFIDRHVFYDGKYLGVELITAFLEDYSRPRYMTEIERNRFLSQIFDKSGWDFSETR
jgi:poly-gamma-glutamate synthesis protein (capsule biosynthesis protein)